MFPVKLRILPAFIFNSRDPIVMGVVVESGVLHQGTPLCVPSKAVRTHFEPCVAMVTCVWCVATVTCVWCVAMVTCVWCVAMVTCL